MKKSRLLILLLITSLGLSGCQIFPGADVFRVSTESGNSNSQQEADDRSEKRTANLRDIETFQQSTIEELTSELPESLASEAEKNPKIEIIDGRTYVNGILIVNKKHPVPAEYAPGVDPKANEAINKLIDDMQNQNLNVNRDTSNFRSYEAQTALYNRYVAANGQATADTFSARPGFSEHQTGLAFDLKDPSGQLLISPTEAQWLLDNAAKYGFIVRYQQGKEAITGYQAEPWHLRYLGDMAQDVSNSGLTLEEYLGIEGGDYQ